MTGARGFSLPVLIVGIVLAGVLMTAIYQVLAANQRISAAQSEQLLTQHALSAAMDLMTRELRGVSAAGGDLTIADEQMVAFRRLRGLGLTCEVLSERPPTLRVTKEGAGGFEAGDQVYVFLDGDPTTGEDDRWSGFEVVSVANDATCGEEGLAAQELRLSGSEATEVRGQVHRGALVRGWEDVLYTVARVDGEAYLTREAGGQRTSLVGPLRPENGFEILFMDASGAPALAATEVATARITLRTQGSDAGLLGAGGDSLTSSVFLRN